MFRYLWLQNRSFRRFLALWCFALAVGLAALTIYAPWWAPVQPYVLGAVA